MGDVSADLLDDLSQLLCGVSLSLFLLRLYGGAEDIHSSSEWYLSDTSNWGPPCTGFQTSYHSWLSPVKCHSQNNFPSKGDSMKLSQFCAVTKVFLFLREESTAPASKPLSMCQRARLKQKKSQNLRRAQLSASGNAYCVVCFAHSFLTPLCNVFVL